MVYIEVGSFELEMFMVSQCEVQTADKEHRGSRTCKISFHVTLMLEISINGSYHVHEFVT